MASESGRMSVAVPSEIQKKLDAIAAQEDRSRNWIVNEALMRYVDLYEWQTRRIEARLKDSLRKDAVFVSSENVDEIVESFRE